MDPRIEDLLKYNDVKDLLSKCRKKTTLLLPYRSNKEIAFTQSKMGGIPNLNDFQEWPKCDECNAPLNFILQIYRSDFSDFYFPVDKNIFQLFRCPNHDCPAAYSGDVYDHKMFHYYWSTHKDKNNEVEIPELDNEQFPNSEAKVQECYFVPEIHDDYPEWLSEDSAEWNDLKHKYGDDIEVLFIEKFLGEASTKYGGYPYWIQGPNHPDCDCGRLKELFFQLGNYENYGLELNGDGIIYYFICKKCGEASIESRCDGS